MHSLSPIYNERSVHSHLFLSISLLRPNVMPSLLKATFIAISLTFLSSTSRAQTPYDTVCGSIANAVSFASQVAYPGQSRHSHNLIKWHISRGFRIDDNQYENDIYHFASASTQPAACSVEPGTVADVSTVVGRLLVSFLQTLCSAAYAAS